MVNLTALQNITPLNLNTSLVNDTTTMIPSLVSNANTQSDNWFGLIIMIGIFIWTLWTLFDDRGAFRLDLVKSLVFSSGVTLMIGAVMLVSNLTTTFSHVLWFGAIFTLSLIATYFLKAKGG